MLVLAPGHLLHREQAMSVLWPELGKRAASNNLRRVLHTARRALDPDAGSLYLASENESLVLCPEGPLWVDIDAFDAAAATVRHSKVPAAYRAAIELYAGELLPGDRYEDWVEEHRRRLREKYLSLLLGLARAYEDRGNYESAADTLLKIVDDEPTREEAHVSLMRLYALSGRKGESLAQYGILEKVLLRELGIEPSASSRALRQEIAAERFPPEQMGNRKILPEGNVSRHNLPVPRSSFVGRAREMVDVKRELTMTRLLTLTGAGGSGKTRLALEVARDVAGLYPDGVWLVELAPLSEGELVPQAVARVLDVREQPGRPLTDALVEALSSRELLLILDNCEHLVEAAAHLVDHLLDTCSRLRILGTSREPLSIQGEVVWQVKPLSLPDGGASVQSLMHYEAVRLFVDRARLRLPSFELTKGNAGAVARVCHKLDGIPLAIELATARMGALAVEQVAQRLEISLDVLSGANRTAEARQQTLRATLDWSHNLLTEAEQELFRRLSVFAGGWTLEAAEAVCSGGDISETERVSHPPVLDQLAGLVDKSLVVAETGMGSAARYRMLEPIRQYARERLKESEEEQVRRRHAVFFLALAEAAEPQLRGISQATWLEHLECEHDNFRAALSWALENGEVDLGLRLGGALGDFWHVRGYLNEGRQWLEDALANQDASSAFAQVRALAHAGYLAWAQIDYERATALSEEGLARSRELGDEAGSAAALFVLGLVKMFQKRFEEASTLFEESLALWRERGDTSGVARTLQALGLEAVARHDYERAMPIHEESLALARKAGDNMGIILALGQGALAAVGRSEHNLAGDLCAEGLALARQPGHPHIVMFILNVWAVLAAAQRRPVHSARVRGAARALGRTIGIADLSPVELHHYGPYFATARSELGETTWEAALSEGGAMGVEEAIEYALKNSSFSISAEPEPGRAPTESIFPRDNDEVSAKAINKAGKLAWEQGDFASARTLHERSLRLHRRVGNTPGIALSLNNLGLVALYQGDLDSATALYEESLSLRRELRDKKGTASSLHNVGLAALYRGDYARAEVFFEESLSLSRELEDGWVVSTVLNNLGLMVLHQGDHERASELQKESLTLRRELGDKGGAAECLEGLAGIAAARNESPRAARLWSAAEALREAIGAPPPPGHRSLYEAYLAPARDHTDETAWEAARSEGLAMTPGEAVAYALSEEKASVAEKAPAGKPSVSLTHREHEVAVLVASGLTTDRQIAGELFISKRTVETHMRNILKKLKLDSRAQLAAWAAEGLSPDKQG